MEKNKKEVVETVRGRKPKKAPLDYIEQLHRRGYSPTMIAWILQRDFDINVSRWTIWRRLKAMGVNFAPSTKDVQREKPGFNAQRFEEVSMDLLAGEVESFDELMDRLEGCE